MAAADRARARPFRGLPLFWQVLLLMLAAVVVAQAMGIVALFLEPPPRPDFNRMSDIAAALAGRPPPDRVRGDDRDDRWLLRSRSAAAPPPRAGMTSDQGFTRDLAERLDADDRDVRLWFEPGRRSSPFEQGRRRAYSVRDGEPLFFTALVAGVRDRGGWTVVQTRPPPLVAPWQRRMLLWFGLSMLALVPVAWGFARALTGPIARFAAAADRLGGDAAAPAVPEEGPAELRTTARALNAMQARLAGYVGERTAMIGAIAHDLRTPLARIAFRVEAAPEPVRDKVMGDVDQMRAMLAATIGFVRNTGTAGPRVPVDLAGLLDGLARQDRDLGRAVATGALAPATVLADPLALERLIQNLIDNAPAYAGAAEVALAREGAQAVLTVADRGPGMAPELIARAFQPFVRGDPSRNRATGGIGLGLTIARALAEDHGGALALANREGGGLVATLRLLRAD